MALPTPTLKLDGITASDYLTADKQRFGRRPMSGSNRSKTRPRLGGRRARFEQAEPVHDESRHLVPWSVRPIFGLSRVVDFLAIARTNTVADANRSK